MSRVIYLLVVLGMATSCQRKCEPVGVRPNEGEIVGSWKLQNSPRGPAGRPALQRTTNSFLLLGSNGVAKLNNIQVEEDIVQLRKEPVIAWRLRTGDATWKLEERGESSWIVWIPFSGNEVMELQVCKDSRGKLSLVYRPDPEMAEPFIFTRLSPGR